MSMKAAMFNVDSEEKSNTGNCILFSSIYNSLCVLWILSLIYNNK